jgi:hypothetical protein
VGVSSAFDSFGPGELVILIAAMRHYRRKLESETLTLMIFDAERAFDRACLEEANAGS